MTKAVEEPQDRKDVASEPRTGKVLARATLQYGKEIRSITWYHIIVTVSVYFIFVVLAAADIFLPIRVIASVGAGLTIVRMFIIYHDAMHGTVLKGSKLGAVFSEAIGMLTLSPVAVWKETHDYHHRNNSKLPGTAIGSYPIVTTRMWPRMSANEKRLYKAARHPLTILTGYFTLFALGMCTASFVRNPTMHWRNPIALFLHVLIPVIGLNTFGFATVLFAWWLPIILATAAGGYLFYAQHNYPGIELSPRSKWNYHHAALRSSSMFEMSPIMHWFTGNIGYHHIHHLNHKIPFYRLPEVYEALPELQHATTTSWSPSDIKACFALKVWDPRKKMMVAYPEEKSA